jgi:hypothetical protein
MTASRCLRFAIARGALYVQSHMRCQISAETWEQLKTAFASGIRLREIARNMGTPGGTVLAPGKPRALDAAYRGGKELGEACRGAIVPACDAAALTMEARAERHVERMGTSQKRFYRISNRLALGQSWITRETLSINCAFVRIPTFSCVGRYTTTRTHFSYENDS